MDGYTLLARVGTAAHDTINTDFDRLVGVYFDLKLHKSDLLGGQAPLLHLLRGLQGSLD
jgi:hypothetical protein